MADETPETVPHADEALKADAADAAADRRRKQRVTAGVAFGIGSAAIVAALLYANRPKKKS